MHGRALLGAVASMPSPPSPPLPVRLAQFTTKAATGEQYAPIALLAIPLLFSIICCIVCCRNQRKLAEATSPAREEEHIAGPREYPMPTAYTELRQGHYQGKYYVPSPQGGKYEHELQLFLEVQKLPNVRGRAQLAGTALESRAGATCVGGKGPSTRYNVMGVVDFTRAKGVIRLASGGRQRHVLFFEQVDDTQIGGRAITTEAHRMMTPLPFKLQWVSGELSSANNRNQQRQQIEFMQDQRNNYPGQYGDYPQNGAYGGYDNGAAYGGYGDDVGGAQYPPYSDPQNPYAGDYPPPGYADAQGAGGGAYYDSQSRGPSNTGGPEPARLPSSTGPGGGGYPQQGGRLQGAGY